MLIRTSDKDFNVGLHYSDVTPKEVYLNRRKFLGAGAAALGALALQPEAEALTLGTINKGGPNHDLLKDPPSPKKTVTEYNNFYEFGSQKEDPAANAPSWKPNVEWPVRIEGEVKAPKILSLDQILKLAPLEERIYRHRCVERWSIVVPWVGIPLSTLLKQVEPTGKAKYVAFETYYNAKEMRWARGTGIDFPYVEGLRLDEAMHPLTLLAVGMYGEAMPNQNGAPIRIVVPWKYGYKSIKSIVRIRFVEKEPPTAWNLSIPNEYGFYSNVNPNRPHPRWSQKEEQRLGGGFLGQGTRIPTTIFNGYGEQVASLYNGMDLIKQYY
jgi:methionine sulfoxide reductase catalytic subunit